MEIIEQEEQKSEKSPTIAATDTTAGGTAYTIATGKMEITEPEREQLQQQIREITYEICCQ